MENTSSPAAAAVKTTPTLADWIFILIVIAILTLVAKRA